MSNALAIASVTALLKDLLNDGLINRNIDSLFNFQITAQPPDRISADGNGGAINRLNIFLYRVTPNTGWSNTRQPSRSASGERLANPFLALDLHYMLSAFASEDLNAEILLGFGMQALHETPVFGRDVIRQALGAGGPLSGSLLPPGFQQLSATALADQFEQIRLTPHYVSMDEISKLWTSMNTPLRMSALYQATVVLIESEASTRSSLPVLSRGVFVRQLHGPNVTRLLSQGAGETQPSGSRQIAQGVGDELILEGSGLRGEVTVVAIGELEVPASDATERRIRIGIPPGLRPGVTGVQVIHRIAKLPPSTEEMPGGTSNVMAFVLHPSFAAVNPIEVLTAELEDNANPDGPVRGRIRLNFAHNIGSNQRAELVLNERNPPNTRAGFAYTFRAVPLSSPPPATVTQREFEFRQVEQASYLVRARVDGAETLMETAGGVFASPSLDIAP
jgi:hypothetical protein